MSVDSGRESTDGRGIAAVPPGTGRPVRARLHETYSVPLFDYCVGLLGNPAAAAAAVQETLSAADAKIGRLRDPAQLRVWLYTIARRQCLGGPRWSGADAVDQFTEEQPDLSEAATATIEIVDVEAGALDQETMVIAKAALGALPDRDREVLNLVFRHGFDSADLAAVLGVSPRRARALVSRASARFEKSAAVAAVLCVGYGWAACPTLENYFGWWDPASPSLTPRLRRKLAGHIRSCDQCAENRGSQFFGPELLSTVPLVMPAAGVAPPLVAGAPEPEPGPGDMETAGRPGQPGSGGFPGQHWARRNRRPMLAAAVSLVVLAGAGGLLYKLTAATAASPRRTAADVTAAGGSSPPAGPAPATPSHARTSAARHHVAAPPLSLPGLSPPPVGVLPVPPPPPPTRRPPSPPSPSPTHHHGSPTPSPTHHSGSPSPSPTPTPTSPSPSPTTTSPTPTPTSPTPTPTLT